MCKPLDEATELVRSLDITLLGLEADAVEALSSYRTERSVKDVRVGLKEARSSMNKLLTKIQEVPHAIAQAGIDGA
jgi:hypothetical protein